MKRNKNKLAIENPFQKFRVDKMPVLTFCLFYSAFIFFGCKKLVEVPEPVNTITTTETFNNDATATSAILGIYYDLTRGSGSGSVSYGNGLTTLECGLSSDELIYYNANSSQFAFQTNALLSTSNGLGNLWNAAYFDIYVANTAIESLQASTALTATTKSQLIGEAKFLRAFSNFYLVNLFGDVPLLTTSAYAKNYLASRTPSGQVYKQIIADLLDAQNLLATDYGVSGGERIRVNKWGATALLARAYLYTNHWAEAKASSATVIANSSLYNLEASPSAVFGVNNQEAILQFQISNTYRPYATTEGNQIIPNSNKQPSYYLSPQLLAAFEPGDLREGAWTNVTKYQSKLYTYPFKYIVRQGSANGNIAQYYTVLRLAEQYLIRAEAEAQLNDLSNAVADLNTIRNRAGLSNLSSSLTQAQVLVAVAQERRIELFAEWGNRWFDLKRTVQADAVLGPIKGINWQTTDQLYPIPFNELQKDPNLTQNPGIENGTWSYCKCQNTFL